MPLEFWGMTKPMNTATLSPILSLRANLLNNLQEGDEGSSLIIGKRLLCGRWWSSGWWTHPKPNQRIWSSRHQNLVKFIHYGVVKMGDYRQGQSRKRVANQVRAMSKTTPPLTFYTPPFVKFWVNRRHKRVIGQWWGVAFWLLSDKALTEQDIITIENIVNQQTPCQPRQHQ